MIFYTDFDIWTYQIWAINCKSFNMNLNSRMNEIYCYFV